MLSDDILELMRQRSWKLTPDGRNSDGRLVWRDRAQAGTRQGEDAKDEREGGEGSSLWVWGLRTKDLWIPHPCFTVCSAGSCHVITRMDCDTSLSSLKQLAWESQILKSPTDQRVWRKPSKGSLSDTFHIHFILIVWYLCFSETVLRD